jgi:K+-transporting ATPase ATPase A chain
VSANGWFQIGFFLLLIFLVTKPLGVFMTRVFSREKTFLDPILRPIEKLVYRLTAVDERREMRWTEYAVAMLLFSGVSNDTSVSHRAHAKMASIQSAEIS